MPRSAHGVLIWAVDVGLVSGASPRMEPRLAFGGAMSHAWVWSVEQQQRRREHDQALLRARAARLELERFADEARIFLTMSRSVPIEVDLQEPWPTVEDAATTETLESLVVTFDALRKSIAAELRDARTRADLAGMIEALRVEGERTGGVVRAAPIEPEPAQPTVARTGGTDVSEGVAASTVRRILGRLDPDVTVAEHRQAVDLAAHLLARSDHPLASNWLMTLREHVLAASKSAQRRRSGREQARSLHAELTGRAEADLLASLQAVVNGEQLWTASLEAEVERQRRASTPAADASTVAAAIAEVFTDLGYEVYRETRPDPAGVVAIYRREQWGPYVARVQYGLQGRLQACLVRTDPEADDPVRDREVEQSFCADALPVAEGLARHGLELSGGQVVESVDGRLPVDADLAVDAGRQERKKRVQGRGSAS